MREFFKFLLWVAAAIGIALGVLKYAYVDIVTVGHDGMAPTMVAGDRVLVWRGAHIDRNDVVLCRHPRDASRWVMARVILEPGETLHVDRGIFVRNRYRMERDIRAQVEFTPIGTNPRPLTYRWGIEQVSDNTRHMFFERDGAASQVRDQRAGQGYFLIGDNRTIPGEDSRSFGPINAGNCRGTVFMRLSAAPDRLPPEIEHDAFDLL